MPNKIKRTFASKQKKLTNANDHEFKKLWWILKLFICVLFPWISTLLLEHPKSLAARTLYENALAGLCVTTVGAIFFITALFKEGIITCYGPDHFFGMTMSLAGSVTLQVFLIFLTVSFFAGLGKGLFYGVSCHIMQVKNAKKGQVALSFSQVWGYALIYGFLGSALGDWERQKTKKRQALQNRCGHSESAKIKTHSPQQVQSLYHHPHFIKRDGATDDQKKHQITFVSGKEEAATTTDAASISGDWEISPHHGRYDSSSSTPSRPDVFRT